MHVTIQWIDVQLAAVSVECDAFYQISALSQLLNGIVGQRHVTLGVEAHEVFHRNA